MATLRKRATIFYAQFQDADRSPRRRRLSLKTSDRSAAVQLLGKLEEAYALGRWDPWRQTVADYFDRPAGVALTVGDAVEHYLKRKAPNVRRLTLKEYRGALRRFAECVGAEKSVDGLTGEDVTAWTRADGVARSTQRKRHSMAKAFFRCLRRHELTDAAPMKRISCPPKEDQLPRVVDKEKLRMIRAALRADYQRKTSGENGRGTCKKHELLWHGSLWHFMLLTGLRIREAARLRWADVDFARSRIALRRQKNRRASWHPLAAPALDKLSQVRETLEAVQGRPVREDEFVFGSPYAPQTNRSLDSWVTHESRVFKRYRDAARINEKLTLHSLRHGHATLLAEAGKSAFSIQKLMRHKSVETSQQYVHLAAEDMRRDLNDVFE